MADLDRNEYVRGTWNPTGRADSSSVKVARYETALRQIAGTTPRMNLGREWIDVPDLDGWAAQRVAADALGADHA